MPALSRSKTWVSSENLTASDLNSEIDGVVSFINTNLIQNPIIADLDLDGNALIIDADGDMTLAEVADDVAQLVGNLRITGLTANRAVATDANKGLTSSATTVIELGYVNGVTSAIQTQLDTKITSTLGATLDANGNEIVLDVDGDSSITADTDDQLDVRLQGVDAFIFDGTTSTIVNGLTFGASATTNAVSVAAHGTDTDIDIELTPKGSGVVTVGGGSLYVAAVPNTFGDKASNQNITGATVTDVTELTALTLPTTSGVSSRSYEVVVSLGILDTSGSANSVTVNVYSGANGNKAENVAASGTHEVIASTTGRITYLQRFTPASDTHIKFGVAMLSDGNCTVIGSNFSTVTVRDVT